ncbi:MAG: hypothetical protein A4E32_00490 [Methanomassiliicoccales archaeon PtaU1.Bin124]|nr:MAG: hypothetical protein A4E32_00490 [Methanomassiliicoccales archaeon PtaU1.Bin124]
MQIKDREFTREEFRGYLKENPVELFSSYGKRRWLKIYCLLVAEDWKERLFSPKEITQLGEIYRVSPLSDDGEGSEQYFLEEYSPGLLLMYTYASDDSYQKELGTRIDRRKGAARMWIKPLLFDAFWKGLMEDTNGYVYLFSGRRKGERDGPCRIRPEYSRRIEYRGNDATFALDEMGELYGVIPNRIYLRAGHDLKLHITDDGLFAAQRATPRIIDLFLKHLDRIKGEILSMQATSKRFEYRIDEHLNIKVAYINAGCITLNAQKSFDEHALEKIKKEIKRFSFIDTYIGRQERKDDSKAKGLESITTTVIDELKGSVFDITISHHRIVIVPKYETTFESFIGFYQGVVELVDDNAELAELAHC